MNIAVRPASLSEEREDLIAVLERNFPTYRMGDYFKWRHDDNPAGPGWCWVLYDRQHDAIRGMTSLFPRPMYIDGTLALVGQVGEFAVDRTHRSLGPAVMLQRATFQPVDSGELTMCYDCPPHDEGMSTFRRLGMHPSCEITRFAYLLRSDEVLEKRLGKGAWTKPLIGTANLALRARPTNHHTPGIQISVLKRDFDDEFTNLDNIVGSRGVIRVARSAELLNWRYRKRSDADIEVLVARKREELLAFLAMLIYPNRRVCIADLFGRDLNEAGTALLRAAIERCQSKGLFCLEGYSSESNQLKAIFETAGFHAREIAARIVAYSKSGGHGHLAWPVGQAEVNA